MEEIVAIVDDDEPVRRALRRLVRSFSYRPILFASGEEFLADLQHAGVRCALVDQHMPGLSGLDVLLCIRADRLKIPVIIITGFDHGDMRRRCMSAGAVGYLVKPLEPAELAQALHAAVGT